MTSKSKINDVVLQNHGRANIAIGFERPAVRSAFHRKTAIVTVTVPGNGTVSLCKQLEITVDEALQLLTTTDEIRLYHKRGLLDWFTR